MHNKTRLAAYAAAMSSLALISACGGGGGSPAPAPPSPPPSAPAPPPPPVPPPVNTAPVFPTHNYTAIEDVGGSVQLLATDAENHALTFAIATPPQHGTATLTAAGYLTYTPAANYFGPDSLTVRVTDSAGAQTTGTFNLTVDNINDAPIVENDELRVAVVPGQAIVLTPVANDHDEDSDTLTPTIVTQPAHGGTIAVNATTRAITFEPTNGYRGPIEFSYRVNDGTVNSGVATVRAVIGEFESLAFLSDYTTPGVREVHVYDGFEVRRVSDPLPAGGTLTSFTLSNDSSTLAYVVKNADADRIFVKSLTGSSPAAVRYVSPNVGGPLAYGISGALNADGTYMWVYDTFFGSTNQDRKEYFVVDTATGTAHRLAGDMAEIIDIRILQWHSHEPKLLMVQGQTDGSTPLGSDSAMSAYLGDATDVRTLDRIGALYPSGEHGSGEGFYYGPDTRYIYHTEYRRLPGNSIINLLRYDRLTEATTSMVRTPVPPDRGMNGLVWSSPDRSRLCFAYYEPSTTTNDGPSKFYAANQATGATIAVSPVLSDVTSCQFASDNRTMIYRAFNAAHVYQHAFVVDSVTPGTIRSLVPSGEIGQEPANWQIAPNAMRIAIPYFNNDGVQGIAASEVGRYYSMAADGTGDAFLFSDTYQYAPVSNFNASNGDGSFIIHSRAPGGIPRLEIMSTHALNLSLPLSAAGETLGVQSVRWMRRY